MPPCDMHRGSGLVWLAVPLMALCVSIVVIIGKPLYIVAFLGAVVVVPLLLRSPQMALFATIAVIPLEEAGVLAAAGPLGRLSLAKIFGALAIASWLINMVMRRERLYVPPPICLLIAYLVVGALSLVGAAEPEAGRSMLFRWCNTILFVLMVCNVVSSWETLRKALLIFVVVSTAISAFAIAQRALPQFQYAQRGAAEISDTVEFGAQVDVIEQDLLGTAVVRAGGTSYHPLILALNTTLLLPLLVILVLYLNGRQRLAAAIALGVNFAALLATGSRSGIVSCAAVLAVLLLKKVIMPNRFLVVGALALPLLVFLFVPADLKDRLFSTDSYRVDRSSSLSYRVEMLDAGLSVWSDHPALGIGLGNLTAIGERMRSDVLSGLASGVHNMYVQIGLETGLVGLVVLMSFCIASLRSSDRLRRSAIDLGREDLRRLGEAFSISVWVLLIFGMSLDVMNFSLKNAWFLLALIHASQRLVDQTTRAALATEVTHDKR